MKSRFALLALIPLLAACERVDETEHCVITRYGNVITEKAPEGLNNAIMKDFTCFTLTEQTYPTTIGDDGKPSPERISLNLADSTKVEVDLVVLYSYDPATVPQVFREKRSPEAVMTELSNAIRSGARTAGSGWTLNDVFASRDKIEAVMLENIQKKIGNRLKIKTIYVRDIIVDPTINKAIVAAREQALLLDKAQKEKAVAEARAQTALVTATAEAEANRLRAQSYAQNPAVLQLEIAKEYAKGLANVCSGNAIQNCVVGGSVMDAFARRQQ